MKAHKFKQGETGVVFCEFCGQIAHDPGEPRPTQKEREDRIRELGECKFAPDKSVIGLMGFIAGIPVMNTNDPNGQFLILTEYSMKQISPYLGGVQKVKA